MAQNPNVTRAMKNGAYHRHLFADEKNTNEQLTVRNTILTSSETDRASLTSPLTDAFSAALSKKKTSNEKI